MPSDENNGCWPQALHVCDPRAQHNAATSRDNRDIRTTAVREHFSFLDALPGPAAWLDSSGKIVAINNRWRAFGLENGFCGPNVGVGVNYLAICERGGDVKPEAREVARGIGAVLAGLQDTFHLEYPGHLPEEERWFLMTVSSAAHANSFGAIVFHLDISAHKVNQRAQQFLDNYFNAPFQEAAIGLAVMDPSGRFVQLNDRYCDMLGYTQTELKSKEMLSVTHPEDRAHNLLLLCDLIDGRRRSYVIEKRYLTKRGGIMWVRNSVSARRNALGHVTSVLAFSEDITNHKLSFHELEEAKARLETASRLSRLGAWEIDTASQRVILSEQANLIYDVDLGRQPSFQEFISFHVAADRDKITEAIESCRQSGASYDVELEVETTKRRRAWVRAIGQAVWEQGRVVSIQGAVQDVTERVLFERKASQNQKMEAIGQLTGGIAHDFNNLLTIVIGNTELLEEQLAEQSDLMGLAQATRSAAERGAKLVEHLLAFARRQPPRPAPIDLAQLINGMSTLLHRTLGAHICISFATQSDLWRIHADLAQLESTILNLCLNARDAMPKGGTISIDVRNYAVHSDDHETQTSLRLGDYVCISVTDSGGGMTPEVARRACEPFFTTKGTGKGSGLGLSMVCGFVQQSKGEIKINSKPGLGTSVQLYLPRSTAHPINVAPQGEIRRGSERILLVDDESDIRHFGRRQLENLGYTVAVCESGDHALDLLRNGAQFDLLLTDMVMPGTVDGIGLAQRAREINVGLKILLTTGYSDQILSEIVKHGFNVLRKPYRKSDLATKVREALAA